MISPVFCGHQATHGRARLPISTSSWRPVTTTGTRVVTDVGSLRREDLTTGSEKGPGTVAYDRVKATVPFLEIKYVTKYTKYCPVRNFEDEKGKNY